LHGVGTKNFEDLSFTMPGDFKQVYTHGAFTCVQNSDMFCCMSPSGDQSGGLIDCGKKDLSVICYQYFFNYNNVPGLRKQYCLAEENHKRANNLCSSLGTKLNVANTWTPSGNNNRYRFYKLN